MCGIAGLLESSRTISEHGLASLAGTMADRLAHRGPDDAGTWADASSGVALAHRRLSIVDLSPMGHQPMASEDGRFVLVFNGEIYDHAAIRRALEPRGHRFRGSSDTEVLLAAITEWGAEEALRRCNGMFALALWDRIARTLLLARDRMGEKPLYFGWAGTTFLFGSELKALRVHPRFRASISREALTLYARYGFVPAPHSIYEGVAKLEPGCLLTVAPARPFHATPKRYWSTADALEDTEAA